MNTEEQAQLFENALLADSDLQERAMSFTWKATMVKSEGTAERLLSRLPRVRRVALGSALLFPGTLDPAPLIAILATRILTSFEFEGSDIHAPYAVRTLLQLSMQ